MRRYVIFILAAIIFLCGFASIGECRNVVFVINTGRSMSTYDPFHTAPESIVWGAQNFYPDDEVGIVAFSDSARVIRPLSKVGDKLVDAFTVEYSGQSDAGAGLLSAIDMLTPKFETQRDIIFITNGEIMNPQSSKNFQAGLEQAKWLGIDIYYINLRYNVDPTNYQLYRNYVNEIPINYNELMTTVRTVLQGDWHTPHIELPIDKITTGALNFEVPLPTAERFKISLLSSSAGTGVLKNVKPTAAIQSGFVKVFDIQAPTTNTFEIDINFPKGTGLTLDVIPTVNGMLKTEVSRSLLFDDYLEITPVYANASEVKIFGDKFFDDKPVRVLINDTEVVGKIHGGTIEVQVDDYSENVALQKIYFEDAGIIFNGDDTAKLFTPIFHYWAWLIAAVCLLTIAGLSWRIYKKNNEGAHIAPSATFEVNDDRVLPLVEDSPKVVNGEDFSYSGKLRIYVIKAPDEENTAPREFNLFRMNSAQVPLTYILEQCALDKFANGFQNIFLNPAKNCIVAENKSNCTITKRNNLVSKGEHVELYYDDSINVATDDEKVEMIFQYKSLKPKEG